MNYDIVWSKKAKKALGKLDQSTRERIWQAVDALKISERSDTKKMKTKTNRMRLRVGDYRVILSVDQEEKAYTVIEVGHRREIYRD